MKKITFLGSKKIGWDCFSYLLENLSELDIEIVQVGTNLSRNDEYKDNFLEYSSRTSTSIVSDTDDIFLETDIIFSVQYHHILTAQQLSRAREASYNLHMAPLPEYRGCNQFSMAIIDQAQVFGTTIHVMDPEIDHGDIVAEDRFEIPQDIWVADLYTQTEERSLALFRDSIADILGQKKSKISQDSLISTRGTSLHYRHEIDKIKHLKLDWPEEQILRHIRATYMPGFTGPYFEIDGHKIYVSPA